MFAQPFLTSLLTGISWPILTALVSLDIERHPWVTVILTCTGFVTALRLFVPGIKVLEILLSFALFNVGLFSTFAVYRISPLHPLSKFPGPRGARISSWWITRHILKTDFNWFRSVEGMHHTWGDFVRVGMAIPMSFGYLGVTDTLPKAQESCPSTTLLLSLISMVCLDYLREIHVLTEG